eukprot:TRINITY_DN34036_c0_g3_i1.p1 TRINITY_DN34036_c0_g3~~TRINITY_DN34036_c0_g3_i1.p1  ORF type:complete len:466 (-),score=79.89 TRINITY_DN34036_c0_g3_i1:147-1466(-)
MGRKHAWKKTKTATASAATEAGELPPQGFAPPAKRDAAGNFVSVAFAASTGAGAAAAAAQAAVGAARAACESVLWLHTSFHALDAATAARAAAACCSFKVAAQALARARLHQAIAGSQLWEDSTNPGENALLALSHLESMAASPFLLGACRDLLRSILAAAAPPAKMRRLRTWNSSRVVLVRAASAEGWLKEIVGSADDLCQSVAEFVFGGTGDASVQGSVSYEGGTSASSPGDAVATAAALLRSLVQEETTRRLAHGKPDEGSWASAVLDIVDGLRVRDLDLAPDADSTLAQFLLGVGELLPRTEASMQAQSGKSLARPGVFFCQILERLLYPCSEAQLVLRCSMRSAVAQTATDESCDGSAEASAARGPHGSREMSDVAAGATSAPCGDKDVVNTDGKDDALKTLESMLPGTRDGRIDVVALSAYQRYYLLCIERFT